MPSRRDCTTTTTTLPDHRVTEYGRSMQTRMQRCIEFRWNRRNSARLNPLRHAHMFLSTHAQANADPSRSPIRTESKETPEIIINHRENRRENSHACCMLNSACRPWAGIACRPSRPWARTGSGPAQGPGPSPSGYVGRSRTRWLCLGSSADAPHGDLKNDGAA